jgi:hypothetical protein
MVSGTNNSTIAGLVAKDGTTMLASSTDGTSLVKSSTTVSTPGSSGTTDGTTGGTTTSCPTGYKKSMFGNTCQSNLTGDLCLPSDCPGASSGSTSTTSASDQLWHDDYSNKVTATGVVTSYPDHERNIPGDVIASRVGSMASAQAVWATQGGTVTSYAGCGQCGVGSSITVRVNFVYIEDTHIYRRDK